MVEIYKDIRGFEGRYQVSNLGNVKSLERKIWSHLNGGTDVVFKEKILKPSINPGGYKIIGLSKNNKSKSFSIHRLVAVAFLNFIPDGYMLHVDHIDGDTLNNRCDNLQELTASHHRYKTMADKPKKIKPKKKYTSKYKGVSWYERSKKWKAEIYIKEKGIKKHIGYFKTEIDAYIETLLVKNKL